MHPPPPEKKKLLSGPWVDCWDLLVSTGIWPPITISTAWVQALSPLSWATAVSPQLLSVTVFVPPKSVLNSAAVVILLKSSESQSCHSFLFHETPESRMQPVSTALVVTSGSRKQAHVSLALLNSSGSWSYKCRSLGGYVRPSKRWERKKSEGRRERERARSQIFLAVLCLGFIWSSLVSQCWWQNSSQWSAWWRKSSFHNLVTFCRGENLEEDVDIRNNKIKCWHLDRSTHKRYDNEGKEKVVRIQMSSLQKRRARKSERGEAWKAYQNDKHSVRGLHCHLQKCHLMSLLKCSN